MKRDPHRRTTKLGAFIKRVTVRGLVVKLNGAGIQVTQSAVYCWLSGQSIPRLPVAMAIEQLSDGAVRIHEIMQHRQAMMARKGNGTVQQRT